MIILPLNPAPFPPLPPPAAANTTLTFGSKRQPLDARDAQGLLKISPRCAGLSEPAELGHSS